MTVQGNGNPSPFTKKPPPAHVPAPKPPALSVERLNVLRWCEWGQQNTASFHYTESAQRDQMFHLKPGVIPAGGIHADCSQFVSAVLHWSGVKGLTDTDYTGTLLRKGKTVSSPVEGDVVIWGPDTGVHAAFYVGDRFTVGFGHSPGAPNRVSLSAMNAYFASVHEPMVRYLSFCQ